jgi:hypothetical protein
MKGFFLMIMFSFSSAYLLSQTINPDILSKVWNAKWIDVPESQPQEYGIYHFRKSFEVIEKPQQFIIHVSADNRYKLFVNGELVSLGPAKGDLYHWNFETIDIAPFINSGKNIIAALVWNFGNEKAVWQASYQTGFILQGNSEVEEILNTDKSWKCIKDTAYSALQPQLIYTYYAAGPGEKVDMNNYPDAWTSLNFDNTSWMNARELFTGTPKYVHNWNSGWMLIPRQIPMMELTPQRLQKVREQKNADADENFFEG